MFELGLGRTLRLGRIEYIIQVWNSYSGFCLRFAQFMIKME